MDGAGGADVSIVEGIATDGVRRCHRGLAVCSEQSVHIVELYKTNSLINPTMGRQLVCTSFLSALSVWSHEGAGVTATLARTD